LRLNIGQNTYLSLDMQRLSFAGSLVDGSLWRGGAGWRLTAILQLANTSGPAPSHPRLLWRSLRHRRAQIYARFRDPSTISIFVKTHCEININESIPPGEEVVKSPSGGPIWPSISPSSASLDPDKSFTMVEAGVTSSHSSTSLDKFSHFTVLHTKR
jgi:hypothetical protein